MKRRHLIYHLVPGFFTLPSDYSIQLHNQIWEMVNYGNGFVIGSKDVESHGTHVAGIILASRNNV